MTMNRFWRGMMTGLFVGAAMGMWLAPHLEGENKDALVSATRDLANRAEKMLRRGRSQVEDAMMMGR